jgi:hypothetical protein
MGHVGCVRVLVGGGANLDARRVDGTTALFIAAQVTALIH